MKRLLSVIFSLLLLFALLIISAELLLYGPTGWFRYEYEKYGVLNRTVKEISMQDALHVTDEWMSYLRGVRGTLVVYVERDGSTQEFFTEREKAHMADVRVIFTAALKARRLSLIACILITVYMSYAEKRRRAGMPLVPSRSAPLTKPSRPYVPTEIREALCRVFVRTTAAVLIPATAAAIAIALNFDAAFTGFHKLFFDNDLWILYPEEDDLINLLPEGFFADTARAVAVIYLAIVFACIIAAVRLGNAKYARRS